MYYMYIYKQVSEETIPEIINNENSIYIIKS